MRITTHLKVGWLLALVCTQMWGAGVDDLLAPLLDDQVRDLTLSPGASGSRRPPGPSRASFDLRENDRILFLGDSLLEREMEYGYFETRLSTQSPEKRYTFLNLSKVAAQALAASKAQFDFANVPDQWHDTLAAAVRHWQPTAVVLSYGTDASLAGEPGLNGFTAATKKLLATLREILNTNANRIVFLGPLAAEAPGAPVEEVKKRNEQLSLYSKAIETVLVDGVTYLQMHGPLTNDLSQAASRRSSEPTLPFSITNLTHLTPYGYTRVCIPFERALRWNNANWRFGMLEGNRFREGGFGLIFHHVNRTPQGLQIEATEKLLPMPNAPGFVDKNENSRPQCYIQVTALAPGLYTLQMDGKPVASGTHIDWARYRLVTDGPQWDQAEQLRAAIATKNQLGSQLSEALWKKSSGQSVDNQRLAALEKQVREAESLVHRLKQPCRRKMELVRTGDAPTPE
jgi:hypothetical protein